MDYPDIPCDEELVNALNAVTIFGMGHVQATILSPARATRTLPALEP